MLKPTGLAIFIGLLFLCTFTVHAQSPVFCLKHVEVVSATRENWAPGIVKNNEERTGGIICEISVRIKKNGDITFQDLILEDQVLTVEVSKDGKRNVPGPFKKGDQLLLIARSDKKQSPVAPDASVVLQMKTKDTAGALLYTFKNKQYLRPVDVLTEKSNRKLPQ